MPSPSSRPIYLRDQADKCRWHASQIADAETQAELLNEPPRFSFTQGRFSKAGLIVGLPDTHAAHKEAVAMFVGLIRDIAGELETHPAWQMEVLDETGKPVFRLRLLGEALE